MGTERTYSAKLARAGKKAVPALAKSLGLSRAAAAETFGATAGLVLAALARHQRKRADDPHAAAAVVEKFGRPADIDAPEIAIDAHLNHPRLDPRLGGLFGETAQRVAQWLADRTGARPEAISKALAAGAPLALGALHADAASDSSELPSLLASVDEAALDTPERLADGQGPCADAFRRVRRSGRRNWLGWPRG